MTHHISNIKNPITINQSTTQEQTDFTHTPPHTYTHQTTQTSHNRLYGNPHFTTALSIVSRPRPFLIVPTIGNQNSLPLSPPCHRLRLLVLETIPIHGIVWKMAEEAGRSDFATKLLRFNNWVVFYT